MNIARENDDFRNIISNFTPNESIGADNFFRRDNSPLSNLKTGICAFAET